MGVQPRQDGLPSQTPELDWDWRPSFDSMMYKPNGPFSAEGMRQSDSQVVVVVAGRTVEAERI